MGKSVEEIVSVRLSPQPLRAGVSIHELVYVQIMAPGTCLINVSHLDRCDAISDLTLPWSTNLLFCANSVPSPYLLWYKWFYLLV